MDLIKTGKTFFALGTVNSIYTFGKDGAGPINAAVARVLQIHNRMSAFQPNSDICRLNAAAGRQAVLIHPDTTSLLLKAKKYAHATNGAFDITLRPLSALWNIGKNGVFTPSQLQVENGLAQTGINNLKIDINTSSAYLSRPGMSVDLGGIAKGYAGDEIKRILLLNGVQNALINLGGNIVAMGANPQGRPWTVGVQNPLMPRGESLYSLDARDVSVITSGVGERFFIKDRQRYHHILDPRTGMPAQSGLLSVTVISPSGTLADALATALFILGSKNGLALLKKDRENLFTDTKTKALFITENLKAVASPALSFSPTTIKEAQ